MLKVESMKQVHFQLPANCNITCAYIQLIFLLPRVLECRQLDDFCWSNGSIIFRGTENQIKTLNLIYLQIHIINDEITKAKRNLRSKLLAVATQQFDDLRSCSSKIRPDDPVMALCKAYFEKLNAAFLKQRESLLLGMEKEITGV